MFHRVDDWRALGSVDYLNKAIRLGAYMGVINARIHEDERTEKAESTDEKYVDRETGETAQYVPLEVGLAMLEDGPF